MALLPHVALAEADLELERGEKVTQSRTLQVYCMHDKATKRILYCVTFNFAQPKPGEGLTYCGRVSDSALDESVQPGSGFNVSVAERRRKAAGIDYIAYHGYFGDTTMRIGEVTGNGSQLYLVTQLAIYHVLEGKEGRTQYLEDPAITNQTVEASNLLYRQAMAYADDLIAHGGSHVEQGTALWFHHYPPAGTKRYRQNVITREPRGRLRVQKVSEDPKLTEGSPGYSLEGAQFEVYANEELTNRVATLKTDERGFATTTGELPCGDYWVKEVTPPRGFELVPDAAKVHIAGGPQTVVVQERPRLLPLGMLVAKVDAETGEAATRVGPSLAGAEFTAAFHAESSQSSEPTRSWTLLSDEEGKVSLDDAHLAQGNAEPLYKDAEGNAGLPEGTLVLTETTPPEGYGLPERRSWTFRVAEEDGALALFEDAGGQWERVASVTTVREPAIRGDVEFAKVEEGTARPMANVVFKVTSQATGEWHLVKTDAKGRFSSRAHMHSDNVNALDAALTDDGRVNEEALVDGAGLWFYGYPADARGMRRSQPDNARGAFPFGTYHFEELRTSATMGHGLAAFDVTVSEEASLIGKGSVLDPVITLATVASDASDGDKHLPANGPVAIEDAVSYEGLTAGQRYGLTCTLYNADTGEPLADAAGKALEATLEFTPRETSGTQKVRLDASSLPEGVSRVVAFERLTQSGQAVACHEDLRDAEQTLYVPGLATTLTDGADGDHDAIAQAGACLVDDVSYHGLVPGQAYRVEGRLVDRSDGQPLRDARGNEVMATLELVPTESAGHVSVSFDVDASALADHQVVATETLLQVERVICSHADLDDADQTVSVTSRITALPRTGSNGMSLMAVAGAALVGFALTARALSLRQRGSL